MVVKKFACSSFQTRFSSFSFINLLLFNFLAIFLTMDLSAMPKGWKKSIGFPDQEFYNEFF